MLTTEAWNAFLKTLEEPPAHVLFILCTTEAHKLPDTARSRLQRFDFRRVSVQELAAHLGSIAKIEGAEVAPEALTLMARSAQGSVRDAVSLLDQALSRPERPLSLATTRMALGLADPEMTSRLVRAVGTADPGEALRAVAQLFEGGCDPRQALHDCARLARAAELCALGCEDAADVDAQELPLCKALAELHPKDGFWVDATERLALAEQDLRQPVDPRLQVEVTVLRLVDEAHRLELGLPTIATLHDQVQELRRQMGELRANPVTASTATLPLPAVTAPGAAQLPRPAAPVVAAAPASAPPPHPALPPANPVDPNQWADLIRKVSSHNMRLGAVLRSCRATLNPAGRLTIAASPGFHMDQLQDPAHQQTIATALREVIGKDCQVSVTPRPAAAHQVGGLGG
jgi:DNA polymerase-3 subunit gamma/tau